MKYALTEETLNYRSRVLHRIQALKDFECQGRPVKAGDLGGWIELEENLSQEGTCWIFDEAKVFDEAQVFSSACVSDSTCVFSSACVSGSAKVSDSAEVFGSAQVYGSACIFDSACVFGLACIFGSADVSGSAKVFDSAKVFGLTYVSDLAQVYGSACIYGSAWVCDSAKVFGSAKVYGSADVSGSAKLKADNWTISPLVIQGTKDTLCVVSHTEVAVGCETHSISHWLGLGEARPGGLPPVENYQSIGEKHEYTPEEIREYQKHLQSAAIWMEDLDKRLSNEK